MPSKSLTIVEIDLLDVLTKDTLSSLLISIFELLTFRRNQIPFTFNTFKYLVNKFENINNIEDWNTNLLNNQRELAVQTLNLMEDITKQILEMSKTEEIVEAAFIFGSTVFTPIETYIIRFPSSVMDHMPENHISSKEKVVRSCLLELITNEGFNMITSGCMKTTNIHVLVKKAKNLNKNVDLFSQNEYEVDSLSNNTKTIEIKFLNENGQNNCCKELVIFEDFKNVNIEENSEEKELKTENKINFNWYQSQTIVKGFRDTMIKGKKIWDQ